MALPSLTFAQREFSAGQITERAARRDDLALQRSGLRRSVNTRPTATGALAQRIGRTAYGLGTGRTEQVRVSASETYEFLFGENSLEIRNGAGSTVGEFVDEPWTLDTLDQIVLAIADREGFVTYPGYRPRHVRLGSEAEIDPSGGAVFGDLIAQTAYPTVISATASRRNDEGKNHYADYGAGIAGDLLVAIVRTQSSSAVTTPSGCSLLATKADTGRRTSIYWRTASSDAAGQVNFVTGSDTRSTHIVYRIRGWNDIEGAFDASDTVNPPSLTPSWGAANSLWLALAAMSRSDQTVTAAPTDYDGLVQIGNTSSSSTERSRTAAAQRDLNATSDNPVAFTVSGTASNPHAATIAIEPDEDAELEKAVDGITNKPASLCIAKASATQAIFGLNFSASPRRCSGVTVYGSNDQGFVQGATPSVTLTLVGKNDSVPTIASPGTSLGTSNFTDTANESAGRAIVSSDSTTEYDYLAVLEEHNGSAATMYLAQAVFTGPADSAETSEWLIGPLVFSKTPEGATRQPYVRYAPPGVTMLCSARSGTGIDVTFSAPVLDSSHVGISFRWHEREVVITSVTSPTAGKANVIEKLPPLRRVTLASANGRDSFKIGDVAIGATSGAEGLVVAFNSTANLDVIVYKGDNFADMERLISPTGNAVVSGAPSEQTIVASPVWDEAMMSDHRGWPRSCTYDRSRLTLCDFPQLPRAIAWSAIAAPTDLAVGAEADDGFLEYVPGQGRVLHVIGGSDQYVLTDIGVSYIPISESNPLAPGRVAFRPIAAVGASSVRPVSMHEGVVYAAQNDRSLIGVIPTGQTSFPYRTAPLSDFHADIVTGIKALAAMTGGGSEAEQYLWVCQDDGTALVGKLDQSNEWVGFVPVTGAGAIKWISSFAGDVRFNTQYDDATPWVMEHVDEARYLDCAVFYHADNTGLRPDPEDESLGPLWFLAGQTVDLMNGDEHLGTREVDEDGFLVAESDDDFAAIEDLETGFAFTVEVTPWLPNQAEGEARGQRMRRRRVKRAAVTVADSTEFDLMGKTFGDETPKSGTYRAPGQGRHFDPEVRLIKSVPGPITILEISGEVTT